MKELERERLLRIEAENRLRDERLDVCDCKSQATELQKELARCATTQSVCYLQATYFLLHSDLCMTALYSLCSDDWFGSLS